MRWMMLLLMPVIFMTGCLSESERDYFIKQGAFLEKRIKEYEVLLDETEATIAEIRVKIETKDIDIASGMALLADAKEQYAGYKQKISEDQDRVSDIDEHLRDKSGGEKWEALAWSAGSILAAMLGIELRRGPSSKKFKNSDGSMKSG